MNTIFAREEAARLHDIRNNVFGTTSESMIGKIYSKFVEMELPGNTARYISPNDVYNGEFSYYIVSNYQFVSWEIIRVNNFTNMRGIDVQRIFDALPKNYGWEELLLIQNKCMSPFVMIAIDKILPNLDDNVLKDAFDNFVHLRFPMEKHKIRVVKEMTPTQYIIYVFLDPLGLIFEHSSVAKGFIHE